MSNQRKIDRNRLTLRAAPTCGTTLRRIGVQPGEDARMWLARMYDHVASRRSTIAVLVVLTVGWPLALSAAPAAAGEGRPDDVPVPSAPTPSPPGSTVTPTVAGPGIYVELPVVDAPFVAANGGSFPSMEQSLWITAGLYQGLHVGIGKLVDPYAHDWRHRLLGALLISAADVLTVEPTPIPGFLAWHHEEWHRAVLSSHGIGSFDDVYRLQLSAEVTNVSHVRDDDLVRRAATRHRLPESPGTPGA